VLVPGAKLKPVTPVKETAAPPLSLASSGSAAGLTVACVPVPALLNAHASMTTPLAAAVPAHSIDASNPGTNNALACIHDPLGLNSDEDLATTRLKTWNQFLARKAMSGVATLGYVQSMRSGEDYLGLCASTNCSRRRTSML
jgi:hypothetical protein